MFAVLALMATHGLDARARIFVQAVGTDYLAVEAEAADSLTNSPAIQWDPITAEDASGGAGLYARGESTLGTPGGVATYPLRFSYSGKYVLYARWKADSAVTEVSPFSANSYSYPRTLGSAPQWSRSLANERDVPESLTFGWTEEFVEYDVTDTDVLAGEPLLLKVGTREAGFILDRLVLAQRKGLTATTLNSLANSPDETGIPELISALAGNDLQSVVVTFSEPVLTFAVTNFTVTNLAILSAANDPADSRRVILVTTNQAEGAEYTLVVNNAAGVSGATIRPGSSTRFRSAEVLPGWVSIPALSMAIASFDFSIAGPVTEPLEFRSYFIPPEDGRYEIYIRNSADTQVTLASADGETNLFSGTFGGTNEQFSAEQFFSTPVLTAGSRHLLIARTSPGTNDPTHLSFAATLSGTVNDPASLAPLSGANIAALLNPDAAGLQIIEQPSSRELLGGQSATLRVIASAEVQPVYYQWQREGTDIRGATNVTYTTPPLFGGDSGALYSVTLRAGGAVLPSSAVVMRINPGSLRISRTGEGLSLHWNESATGATLEETAKLGPDADWEIVEESLPGAGTLAAPGTGSRFFRLRN